MYTNWARPLTLQIFFNSEHDARYPARAAHAGTDSAYSSNVRGRVRAFYSEYCSEHYGHSTGHSLLSHALRRRRRRWAGNALA